MKSFEYHFEPKIGWINDPNGLVYFKGEYHAFCQHFPYAPAWGIMHWGHAVSKDLLHWEELPIALRPDQTYENLGGCYSGSAIVKDDVLYLFYTSVSQHLGQTQSVAMSTDGRHFTKYAGNPIIASCPVDSGAPLGNKNFRDPKVTFIDGHYYMVCGSGADGVGKLLLFTSDDLLHWEYVNALLDDPAYGTVIECPDLFRLGDEYVLVFSYITQDDGHAIHFMAGDFDGHSFTPRLHADPEAGPDFYAPQTFLAPDGRRLLMGWMYHWGKPLPPGSINAGALSLPREVVVTSDDILLKPIAEAAPLLKEESPYVQYENGILTISDGVKPVVTKAFPERPRIQVLEDNKAIEVFVNDGQWIASTWLADELL